MPEYIAYVGCDMKQIKFIFALSTTIPSSNASDVLWYSCSRTGF